MIQSPLPGQNAWSSLLPQGKNCDTVSLVPSVCSDSDPLQTKPDRRVIWFRMKSSFSYSHRARKTIISRGKHTRRISKMRKMWMCEQKIKESFKCKPFTHVMPCPVIWPLGMSCYIPSISFSCIIIVVTGQELRRPALNQTAQVRHWILSNWVKYLTEWHINGIRCWIRLEVKWHGETPPPFLILG